MATDLLAPPAFTWDARRQRYADTDGRTVTEPELKAVALAFARRVESDLADLSAAMVRGDVTVGDWQDETAAMLKALHLAAWALAVGGFRGFRREDYAAVGDILAAQYAYLDRFARQVERRHPRANTEGDVLRRARLYARAANATYEAGRRESHRRLANEAGVLVVERNILAVSEHCRSCVVESERGWVPLGTLIPVGGRICGVACRCRVQYFIPPLSGEDRAESVTQ